MRRPWLQRVAGLLTLCGAVLATPLAVSGQMESREGNFDMPPAEFEGHVVKILRTSNKAQINRYVGKVYTFEHVNPGQINNFFHSALLREEGAAYTFVGPDGTSGKIFVICPAYQIPYFDELAKQLDRTDLTSAPGSKYVYKQLQHRSVANVPFLTILRQYATNNSVVLGDIETNAVFIFDSPAGADHLVSNLDGYLDTPTPVVNTKVTIYEIQLNNDGTLGLDYEDYKNGPYQFMLAGTSTWSRFDGGTSIEGSDIPTRNANFHRMENGYTAVIDLQLPSAYLDMLVDKGKARVVTETQLVTSSSEPASIFTGEQVLYYGKADNPYTYSRSVTGSTASREIPVEIPPDHHNASGVVVRAIDTGVSLSVVPMIGSEQIELNIDASVVSLLGFTETGEPILNSRRTATTATVPNGDQLVIGGLVRERQARTTYKMPILGSLPVIGWVFGGETEVLQKSMLVVVAEPTIDRTFTTVSAKDQEIVSVSSGEMAPDIPDAAWGFDMFLLDHE